MAKEDLYETLSYELHQLLEGLKNYRNFGENVALQFWATKQRGFFKELRKENKLKRNMDALLEKLMHYRNDYVRLKLNMFSFKEKLNKDEDVKKLNLLRKDLIDNINKIMEYVDKKYDGYETIKEIKSWAPIIIAILMFIVTWWMANANVSLSDAQAKAYSPQISTHLTFGDEPYGYIKLGKEHVFNPTNKGDKTTDIPIKIYVFNKGLVPTIFYAVRYNGTCGKGNWGLFSGEEYQGKMITTENSPLTISDDVYIISSVDENGRINGTIGDIVPCETKFTIFTEDKIEEHIVYVK